MTDESLVRRNRNGKIIRNLPYETKKMIKEMSNNICRSCGEWSDQLEIDHIVPMWEGGSDDVFNLQPLCVECHKEKSAEEATRYSKLHPVIVIIEKPRRG